MPLTQTQRQLWRRLSIILILWLTFATRVYRLDHQSFWNDEGNSARLSERSLDLIIEGTASDVHPPLYYLILAGARPFIGATEFSLRFISVLAGLLTVASASAIGRALGNRQIALWVGLFTAVSPPLIYYSQEARMYSLLGLLATASTLALLRWWRTPERWGAAVAYILLATAGLYTHYSFPAVLLAHNSLVAIYLLATQQRWLPPADTAARFWRWCGLMVTTFLLYAPWLPIFMRSQGQRPPGDETTREYITQVAQWLFVGGTGSNSPILWLTLPILLTLLLWRQKWSQFSLFTLWLLIPITLMWLVGATLPSYMKFFTAVVPALWLLIAFGLDWLRRQHIVTSFVTIAVTAFYLFVMGQSLNNLYHNPAYFRANYRGIAQQIEQEAHPSAAVILNAPNQWEVFTYYYQDASVVYPLPRFVTSAANITAELEAIKAQHGRIYAIFWGSEGFDPERVVESWLDTNGFKAIDEWRGDLRFVMYALPGETATQPTETADLRLGDNEISLTGWATGDVSQPQRPGDVVQLTLFWQATRPLDNRYKIFIHLLDEDGTLVAQRDSEPVGNLAPTNRWEPQQTIIDNHGILLPPTLPNGRYTLSLGMYDITNPAVRLPITTNNNAPTDTYSLASFEISAGN